MEIRLTRAAADQVQILRDQHKLGSDIGLRVSLRPSLGGAARFALDLEEGPGARDRSWQSQGVIVFCDPKTYLYLGDIEIDWSGERGGFWIREQSRTKIV